MQARILIADDQADILSALKLLLKREGFEVATATSPAGVLDIAARERVDVALVDLNYARDTTSGKEGLELVDQLRKRDPEMPVVVMTAWATEMSVPEMALPTTIESREMGATSISFMNPNSRSQTIEMDEKIDENRIVMPIMPGKMNWRYENPACGLMSEPMPFPTTKSQSTGRASVPRRRLFSRKNFLNSRRQMTYTGRHWIIAAPSGDCARTRE